jgi:AraC-like DNA-binding protein
LTFRARFLANIIRFASQRGAGRNSLLAITGHSMEELNDDSLEFPAAVYNHLVEEAVRQTGDPLFGLHTGEYMSLSAAGLITQIIQSSSTVGEALQYICDFNNLGCRAMPYEVKRSGNEVQVQLHANPAWAQQSAVAVRHTAEAGLVFTLRQFQHLTQERYLPLRVELTFDRNGPIEEYERLFLSRVYFGKEMNALILDPAWLEAPIVTSDFHLLQILVRYAEERLAREQSTGFYAVVRQSILHLLKPQFPTIDQVAGNLNISVRTLQRRLRQEGLTFKQMLDELKQDLALDYLSNPSLSVKEIGHLLDYSDTSAFVRSFKRWKGLTPNAYRTENRRAAERI